jgi:hypothetical protein
VVPDACSSSVVLLPHRHFHLAHQQPDGWHRLRRRVAGALLARRTAHVAAAAAKRQHAQGCQRNSSRLQHRNSSKDLQSGPALLDRRTAAANDTNSSDQSMRQAGKLGSTETGRRTHHYLGVEQ